MFSHFTEKGGGGTIMLYNVPCHNTRKIVGFCIKKMGNARKDHTNCKGPQDVEPLARLKVAMYEQLFCRSATC